MSESFATCHRARRPRRRAVGLAALLIWLERRLLALWQDRYGPNRVGPFGLLQVVADMIKIFIKEDWIPPFADKPVFVLAPAIIVVDDADVLRRRRRSRRASVVADLNIGLLFFLAMSSLGVYSVALAGWASNNKYSLLGGLRAAAQMLSYEVFMGLSLMGVVMLAGSFNLTRHRRSPAADLVRACRSSSASWSSSSPAWPRRAACPSTCRRRRASWWPASTPNIPA